MWLLAHGAHLAVGAGDHDLVLEAREADLLAHRVLRERVAAALARLARQVVRQLGAALLPAEQAAVDLVGGAVRGAGAVPLRALQARLALVAQRRRAHAR
eukprot:CAMPEP_0197579650 /NCGR_PEP_ID=MMETSP1326-20131121/3611_1 /TAXON_ID=1155430 /ORGANISM="Genus nov. species nov., Strain RCC2288" /LENGTH=99 /DNA_ID=CAMNT_0043143179 /DNA_START=511 /DNA_END=807 /DNA_ORIENTATION=-